MKIGVTSYSFAQYIDADTITLYDVADLAAELGFDGLE